MIKKGYDLVFSLGSVCFTTVILRNAKLQDYSHPFDWLAGSTLLGRAEIIEKDFKDWINIEDLELTGTREHPEPCNIYLNQKTRIFLNHDFALGVDLEISHPKVFEKYQRRIDRLLNLMRKSKKTLMVYIDEADQKEVVSDEDLILAQEKLQTKFKNSQIDLLYIHCSDDKKPKEIKINKNIKKIFVDYTPIDTINQQYVANLNVLVKILKRYRYKKQNLMRFNVSKSGIQLALLMFLPTILSSRLKIFNFEFDFCLGKVRD